ncbi:MAG: hypothetical protein ACI8ZO_000654 [Flavobacteriales bacterium]|jgi:hypothetical protein
MDSKRFIDLVNDPINSAESDRQYLEDILEVYPYCQSANTLFVKVLQNQGSFQYNNKLRIAAAYACDRSQLYELMVHGYPESMKAKRWKPEAEYEINPDIINALTLAATVKIAPGRDPEQIIDTNEGDLEKKKPHKS